MMKEDTFTFRSADRTPIFVYHWHPSTPPVGVIQIAHGMGEHAGRYDEFATFLAQNGYAVYANDHRGHGRSRNTNQPLGHFRDHNGWLATIEDLHKLTGIIQRRYPDLPIFLFGHSMGSFMARSYSHRFGRDLSGVILSGTGTNKSLLTWFGRILARSEARIKGKRTKSALMNQLAFGSFNKNFQPCRTPFDWLSRERHVVDQFVSDAFCGQTPSTRFFYDLFHGMKDMDHPKNIRKIPKRLPILLVSGDQDPVGGFSRDVIKTYERFRQAGIRNVEIKLYPGARHEVINETNRSDVYADILDWLQQSPFS